MTSEKKVRDLMIPIAEYSTIQDTAMVRDAVETLAASFATKNGREYSGHRSVLVLDDCKQAVGLLSFRDLIRAVEPRLDPNKLPGGSLPWMEHASVVAPEGYFSARSRVEGNRVVRDVMRPLKLITIEAAAPLMQAVQIMVSNDVGLLPVTENGEVIGMVRINELFIEIARIITDQS